MVKRDVEEEEEQDEGGTLDASSRLVKMDTVNFTSKVKKLNQDNYPVNSYITTAPKK